MLAKISPKSGSKNGGHIPVLLNYKTNQSSIKKFIPITFFIFLINPLLGIFSMFLLISSDKGFDDKAYKSLYFLISLFFGVVNTTRIPVSDLLRYKEAFEEAGQYSLFEYLKGYPNEIVYYIFSYISNNILFGNFGLYLILVTFIQYYLVFISMHKLFRRDSKNILIYAIAFHFLSANLLFSSVHLLRQMTAASIFIYYFISLHVDKKNKWWLIPIVFLTHSASLILFPILLIPKLKRRIDIRNIVILLIVSMSLAFFADRVISFFDIFTRGIPVLNYPFQRFYNMKLLEHSWYEGTAVWTIRFSYIRFAIIPLFIAYFFKPKKNNYYWIINFCLIYIFILELFVAANLTYMQMRMAYYLYPFYSIIIAIMLSTVQNRFGKDTSKILAFLLIAYVGRGFVKTYVNTEFLIASLDKIVLTPFIIYLYNIF